MLIFSSLLLWAVIQVMLSGSQANPQIDYDYASLINSPISFAPPQIKAPNPFAPQINAKFTGSNSNPDPPLCKNVGIEKCQDTFVKTHCTHLCNKESDPDLCQFIKTDRCQEASVKELCRNKCNSPPIECPSPWFIVGHQCFRVDDNHSISVKNNWIIARGVCRKQGGDLAQPNDLAALGAAMVELGYDNSNYWYWLGGDALTTDVEWIWLDGTIISSTVHNVNAGVPFPHINSPGNCVLFWPGRHDQGLGGGDCEMDRPFVCERK